MKMFLGILAAILIVIIVIAMFDFQVTESGSLPDVAVTGGEMPDATVRGPDFQVETETMEVEVPTDVEFELPEDRESKDLVE